MIDAIRDRLLYCVLRHVPRDRPFVFGIGLSKTGTTSLSDALGLLGYRAFHLPPIAKAGPGGRIVMDWPWWVYRFDALTDLTVAVLYRELADTFPKAQFIYTHRAMDPWLDSCRRHFTPALAQLRVDQGQAYLNDLCDAFYGSHVFDAARYRAAYEAHDAAVHAFFASRRPLLKIDVTAGDGWQQVCPFLGVATPDAAFPVSNRGRAA